MALRLKAAGAPAGAGVVVYGVPETIEALKHVELEVSAANKVAVAIGGDMVAQHARAIAPFRDRSGKLRKGIRRRGLRASATTAETKVTYDKKTFWGKFQEKGTKHQRPYPFLAPALEQSRTQVEEAMRRVYQTAVERVK